MVVEVNYCEKHQRYYPELVCVECYDEQAARVEVESANLRQQNTTSALRQKVLELQAERNGHGV